MTRNQKIVILIGIGLVVLMGLFPPWVKVELIPLINFEKETYAGYHLIIKPPSSEGIAYFRLDFVRLQVQWGCVIIMVGGFLLVLKDKENK